MSDNRESQKIYITFSLKQNLYKSIKPVLRSNTQYSRNIMAKRFVMRCSVCNCILKRNSKHFHTHLNPQGESSSDSEDVSSVDKRVSSKLTGKFAQFNEETNSRKGQIDGSQNGGSDESLGSGNKNTAAILIVKVPNKLTAKSGVINQNTEDDTAPYWHRWELETAAGNVRDMSGTNPDTYQPDAYPELNRRFVFQYPYTEIPQNVVVAPDNKEIVPIQAPLDVVQKVAKQSALEEAAKPQDNTQDMLRNKILRTGEYWNEVWVEEVDPKSSLRMSNNPVLGIIKAKIKPGSEFYDMVASMRKISPRLLYIINDNEDGRRSLGVNLS